MRQNTSRVIDAWERGEPDRGSRSIWTDGTAVWSYETCIAVREGDGRRVLNMTRYSVTTCEKQNALAEAVPYALHVSGLKRGAKPADLAFAAGPPGTSQGEIDSRTEAAC